MFEDKNKDGNAFDDMMDDLDNIGSTGKSQPETNDKSSIIHEDINIHDTKIKTDE